MNALIINNRLAKIFGGMVKGFSYCYHFLFPAKRFTIPACSAPRKKAKHDQKIPRIVWQTNYTDRVTLPVYMNYLFNRWMAPTYEHRFVSTEGRAEFIKANFSPDVHERYMRIQIGAGQADVWRVLVLLRCGGVYFDIDAHAVTSLDSIVRPEDREVFIRLKSGEVSNYFIASAPENPYLEKIARKIMENIDDGTTSNIYTMTGPGTFNEALEGEEFRSAFYKYTAIQGSFTNERFQYVDKPQGKWTKAQGKMAILREKN